MLKYFTNVLKKKRICKMNATIELIGFNFQLKGIQRETESVGLYEGL